MALSAPHTHCPRVKPMNLFLLASRKCSMSFCLMEQQSNAKEKGGKETFIRAQPRKSSRMGLARTF